jgi:hypothetical protein
MPSANSVLFMMKGVEVIFEQFGDGVIESLGGWKDRET